jgi:hypothetical protein
MPFVYPLSFDLLLFTVNNHWFFILHVCKVSWCLFGVFLFVSVFVDVKLKVLPYSMLNIGQVSFFPFSFCLYCYFSVFACFLLYNYFYLVTFLSFSLFLSPSFTHSMLSYIIMCLLGFFLSFVVLKEIFCFVHLIVQIFSPPPLLSLSLSHLSLSLYRFCFMSFFLSLSLFCS